MVTGEAGLLIEIGEREIGTDGSELTPFRIKADTSTALKNMKCLAIGNSDAVRSGDAVFTIGFPLPGLLASTPSVAQGIISNVSGLDNDPRMFQISLPIQAGNSGNPLLDSGGGRVIGVVTSILNSQVMLKATGTLPQNVNFATKSSYLRSILSMAPSSDCAEAMFKQPLTARDMQDHYSNSIVPIRVSR